MADYYTQLSFGITGTTKEQRDFMALCFTPMENLTEEEIQSLKPEFEFDPDSSNESGACYAYNEHVNIFIIYSEESGDPERVADVLCAWQQRFRIEEPISFEFAATCSKMVPDAFGGGGCVVYHGEAEWINTGNWCAQKIQAIEQRRVKPAA